MGVESLSNLVTNSHQKFSKENLVTKVTIVTGDQERFLTKRNKRGYSANLARSKADYLARKLNNPSRLAFYLKCAWNLTDTYLDRLLDIALRKSEPAKYFSRAAANEMRKNDS